LTPRQSETSQAVAPALYDGKCFYPQPDAANFDLESYLGRWYQVAGTAFGPTAGCKCVFAEYSLNDNGTVNVFNSCELDGRQIPIRGTATPVDAVYGEAGVFRVQFPGTPPEECPGPNYIVQDILPAGLADNSFAIVQAANFTTLFLLSRSQNVPEDQINAWLQRAGRLGTDLDSVTITNQSNCSFT